MVLIESLGKITAEENHAISVVLEQLIADLQSKDQYEEFDEMNDDERRVELLLMLFDRTKSRRDKVKLIAFINTVT